MSVRVPLCSLQRVFKRTMFGIEPLARQEILRRVRGFLVMLVARATRQSSATTVIYLISVIADVCPPNPARLGEIEKRLHSMA